MQQNQMLIVIECKRKKRRIKLPEVEAFVTKLKDVSASKGVMVAPAGFDEGAKACAALNDIKLLSYREASEADWNFSPKLTAVRFTPDWIKAFFGNDSGLLDVALETCVRFEGVEEPVTLRTLIEPLLQELVNSQVIGQVMVEADLRPPAVLPNGVNLTFMRAETYLRAFEYLPESLKLADGHVLMDSSSNVPQVSSLHSASIDTEHLFQQPGRELTQEELERVRATCVATTLVRNPKRFVRVHASVTAKT